MKFPYLSSITLLCLMMSGSILYAQQKEVSGVYVGGHIRRERPTTITKLRNSGFTYVLLFNVHVDPDGTLKTDGETICKDGKYVFSQTQPYYQQDIANLKKAPTSISRIDIVIGGWGNDSYDNIKNLIAASGTGEGTMLYKNFKALKEAVPEIDGVNNDDEHCYDVTSAAKFHIMMYDLGYYTTLAPYTNKSFWTSLNTKIRSSRSKAVDRVMIQCYDGGAGNVNSVGSWSFTGVKNRHAGLMYYSNDWSVEKNSAQFQKWKDDGVAVGGFVWVYNDESWNLNAWATSMNRIYGALIEPEETTVVKCYSGPNYTGYCINLPVGKFYQADLAVRGLTANDLESIEIAEYYKARLYIASTCTGSAYLASKSVPKFSSSYANKINSINILVNETAINGISDNEIAIHAENNSIDVDNGEGELLQIFDAAGALVTSKPIEFNSESIETGSLTRGIYIAKIADKSIKFSR